MSVIKFPEDFTEIPHQIIPGAKQWLFKTTDKKYISIVGGGIGIHGDGVRTFEMWDTRNMHDPQGYMTTEEINKWLEQHHVTKGE
jgi:hypothetical protein